MYLSKKEYIVEKILAKEIVSGKSFYKIKWFGYKEEESTWEPEICLNKCKWMIVEFDEEKKREKEEMLLKKKRKREIEMENEKLKQNTQNNNNNNNNNKNAYNNKDQNNRNNIQYNTNNNYIIIKKEILFNYKNSNSEINDSMIENRSSNEPLLFESTELVPTSNSFINYSDKALEIIDIIDSEFIDINKIYPTADADDADDADDVDDADDANVDNVEDETNNINENKNDECKFEIISKVVDYDYNYITNQIRYHLGINTLTSKVQYINSEELISVHPDLIIEYLENKFIKIKK